MQRILAVTLTAAAVVVASAGPVGAQAASSAAVEEQIKKIEKDRAAAVTKADVAALEPMTSDDYTLIDRNGRVRDKAQTMSAIKTGDIKITSNEVSDLKVRVYGDTAVVTGRADTKGTVGGKDVSGPMLFTRVYVKKNGRWQSVAFQQTAISAP
jgi:ketosteroid isomerase-like protein